MIDLGSGVICFTSNFADLEPREHVEIRTTHLADYRGWQSLKNNQEAYIEKKHVISTDSVITIEKIIGKFSENIIYEDTITPLTIERFTGKIEGAIYGCPYKIKDGKMGYDNLFLAGTDQGYLGIIGSLLSGIAMVNQHILPYL
jgi:phytoene dehydrogenase-like protein